MVLIVLIVVGAFAVECVRMWRAQTAWRRVAHRRQHDDTD